MDSLYSEHILDDKIHMDSPHNLGGSYMNQLHSALYKLRLIHMGLVYMELVFLAPQELETGLRRKMC